jgi:YidC/Oxa1 family membrane protein insertase
MDWRTIVAVGVSVVIIIAGMLLQPVLFPPKPATTSAVQPQGTAPQPTPPAGGQQPGGAAQSTGPPAGATAGTQPAAQAPAQAQAPAAAAQALAGTAAGQGVVALGGEQLPPSQQAEIVANTDLLQLTFLTDGATLSSVKLKQIHNADGSPVQLVLDPTAQERFFDVAFGDAQAAPVRGPFVLRQSTDGRFTTYSFSRGFLAPNGVPFTLTKSYVVAKDDYLIELRISITSPANEVPALGTGGFAYTLGIGPQIGPPYTKLDGRNDYRNFVYWWVNGKGKQERKQVAANGSVQTLTQPVTWIGVVGKYFAVIGVPSPATTSIVLDSKKGPNGQDRAELFFSRPPVQGAQTQDVYRFYLGPEKREVLAAYNRPDQNAWGISNLQLDQVITSPILIGWLANIMAWLLDLMYRLIPNYGVAIILVTLFTKLLFLPLTFKSSESMARMAALNPKMQEIRERLKGKPELMNQEIAKLYREEKVNPLSGCLPLLLQLPIFFALYNVFNTHFELRGAAFIPGWISDLSQPESVLQLPFTVPIVGWTALRLLPFIMLGTQLLSSKIMQPPTSDGSANQMKLLNYAMPVVFLFILYDMPSGLTLYWTVQNIFSILQQIYINWLNKKKKAALALVQAQSGGTQGGGSRGPQPPRRILPPPKRHGRR